MSEKPVLDKEFVACLRCPETRTPLQLAERSLVDRVNQAIAAGRLRDKVGRTLKSPLDGGLLREDGKILYPILDGIPILLADEGIPLEQFQ
jgi:uncharacterized protein YbaR (Trm112 family)